MSRIRLIWQDLRASFWLVPSLIVTASFVLALVMLRVDLMVSADWVGAFGVGADGARAILSTIAGSMITVVGVTFSMTLMTLVLASSQYSPRILRNFMDDRVTQMALGVFAGIFTYCLVVLRTIRGGEDEVFVPGLSVTLGGILAIGGIGVLILFIHHIASSIQASAVIASAARETQLAVHRLFPEPLAHGSEGSLSEEEPLLPMARWQAVPVRKQGYIQSADTAALIEVAKEWQVVIRMELGIGAFAIEGCPLASVAQEKALDEATVEAVQSAFTIGRQRTVHQDAAFGVRQIVDIALRALSPSLNDTTTAVVCIDYLTAILVQLASRQVPSATRYAEGKLCLLANGPTFESLLHDSFDQIRESARDNGVILARMLDALAMLAGFTADDRRCAALREQAEKVAEVAAEGLATPSERSQIAAQVEQCLQRCGQKSRMPIEGGNAKK